MALRTRRPDSADSSALLDELDGIRLENDWSFRRLAREMQGKGVVVSAQTLHQLLTDRSITPFDRTIHKIRLYLQQRRAAAAVARRKRAV